MSGHPDTADPYGKLWANQLTLVFKIQRLITTKLQTWCKDKDKDPFKTRHGNVYLVDVRVDLCAPFAGDSSLRFLSWVRQLDIAVGGKVAVTTEQS